MTRLRLTLAALALIVVSACGGATGDSASAVSGDATEPTSELFGSFTTIDNGQIDLGSLEGQDVVLWFWAPW